MNPFFSLPILRLAGCIVLLPLGGSLEAQAAPAGNPTRVELRQDAAGRWTLWRGNDPYFVRGVGGSLHLELIPEFGGNSLRTWGINQLEVRDPQGRNLLDRAHELGLTVTVGIWLQQARRGFKFDGGPAVMRQREAVRAAVRQYRDHPAVLVWGLGNEVEIATPGDDPALWQELNELARIVKAEDPHHPVMTVLAGAGEKKIRALMEHCPEIDILGINSYGGAPGVSAVLKNLGWKKPWMLTEFGPAGPWEVKKTPWGAALEPTGEEKAEMYRKAWETNVAGAASQCLGGYAFNWGHKQEGTSTWFGLFLATGERTAGTDALARVWSGRWPSNRCPEITGWSVPFAERVVPPHTAFPVAVEARDPEGQPLTVHWWIMAETLRPKIGGDMEAVPETVGGAISSQTDGPMAVKTPSTNGAYRLFVKVVDPLGGASVRNTPFRVAKD